MQSPTPIKRRLNELGLRSRLRQRPRVQGRILAPAGAFRRLPSTAGLYFPFYHDVLPEYAGDLRRHLRAFRRIGPLVTWDEALDVLAGRRELTGPMFCLSFDDGHLSWRDVVAPILREPRRAGHLLPDHRPGRPARQPDLAGLPRAASRRATRSARTRVTHPRLADRDDAAAAREITDSKKEIEDELGVEIRDFAAPYGHPAVDFGERDVRTASRRRLPQLRHHPARRDAPGRLAAGIRRQGLHPAWPLMAVRTRIHE